jgi:hypothetical protein
VSTSGPAKQLLERQSKLHFTLVKVSIDLEAIFLLKTDKVVRRSAWQRKSAEVRHLPNFGVSASELNHMECVVCAWQADCSLGAHEFRPMTLRIEKGSMGDYTVLKLIGQIRFEDLDGLRAQMKNDEPQLVLDLDELALVDVEVVRYLSACESRGIKFVNCPPYIREWIKRESEKK